jgi:transcriptional regulator with XRE-family HTH domain
MKLSTANVAIHGPRLRRRRKLAGLNVAALASLAGCSAAYISILETRPERSCSPEVFARICDALDLPRRSRGRLLRPEPEQEEAA